jgi:hypothetical protein
MKSTRRNFLLGSGATFLAGMLDRLPGQTSVGAQDIRPALLAAGFNPDAPDAVLMAIVADVHISLNPATQSRWTDHLNDDLVNEINGLQPRLTHLVFDGDVVNSHGPGSGLARNQVYYEIAREEMRLFKSQLGRFRSDLELVTVPGNHDTDNQENLAGGVPQLWLDELATPPYQKRVLGGVAVFFLNSGHAGDLGPVQAQWFADEVAALSPDQEVLIVAHHPSLFYLTFQTGLKRKVVSAFAGHRAPVWLIGGHDHGFGESLFLHRGTRFIQMETTTGNPVQWGDGNHPGYAVLGLQDGRVACRMYRSLNLPVFFGARKPVDQLTPRQLIWPFELIDFPAALFEEGEYDRTQYVVNLLGNDVISYITYLQFIVYRIDLSRFGGKVHEFLVSAGMASTMIPTMTCSFSEAGPNGPWVDVAFQPPDIRNIYHIPIPSQFRSSPQIHVRVATSKPRYEADISLGGWGLAAAGGTLNGYEKWISTHYRTILQTPLTAPLAKPPGSQETNLEHFAFNIPTPVSIASGVPIPPISGKPVHTSAIGNVINFRFARRSAASAPLVTCDVEVSENLTQWTTVNVSQLAITPLDADWEEARVLLPVVAGHSVYCRARVTSLETHGVSHIAAGDLDGDGVDDLLQYAFDLGSQSGGYRNYDPSRPTHKAGIPIQSIESARTSRIIYPRMRPETNSGVIYRIQRSPDLNAWSDVPSSMIAERILRSDGDWDEVEATIVDIGIQTTFYRVSLELSAPLSA